MTDDDTRGHNHIQRFGQDEEPSPPGPDRNKILLDDKELTAQIRSIAEQGTEVIDDFVNLSPLIPAVPLQQRTAFAG